MKNSFLLSGSLDEIVRAEPPPMPMTTHQQAGRLLLHQARQRVRLSKSSNVGDRWLQKRIAPQPAHLQPASYYYLANQKWTTLADCNKLNYLQLITVLPAKCEKTRETRRINVSFPGRTFSSSARARSGVATGGGCHSFHL